jgi:hypothetical protein
MELQIADRGRDLLLNIGDYITSGDRYPPMNLFVLAPDLAIGFDPVLRELDHLLEDEAILRGVKADLARRSRRSLTAGRPSTPVEVSCACSWSSGSTAGATKRSNNSSAAAWCCASSAGSTQPG